MILSMPPIKVLDERPALVCKIPGIMKTAPRFQKTTDEELEFE